MAIITKLNDQKDDHLPILFNMCLFLCKSCHWLL